MSHTFTPILKKKSSKHNYGILTIRHTYNRSHTYQSLSIRLEDKYWNKNKKEVRKNHPDYQSLNQKIDDKISELKKLLPIKKDLDPTLLSTYIQDHIDKLRSEKRYGNSKKYNTTLNHLLDYAPLTKFSDIDFKWIDNFKSHLLSKSIGSNTANNYLKCVQKLYRQAIKEKVFRTYEDPFNSYSLSNNKKLTRSYLTMENLKRLISADMDKDRYYTKMMFLTQIYGQGLRVSDLFTIRYKNIHFDSKATYLRFVQYKGKSPHEVVISNELMGCIFYFIDPDNYRKSDYIYDDHKINEYRKSRIKNKCLEDPNGFIVPFLKRELFENTEFTVDTKLNKTQVNHISSRTASYNKQLKKLIPYTGNPSLNITSHTSRHSFANLMLINQSDVYNISKSLGHSGLEITESYIEGFNRSRVFLDNLTAFKKIRK